MFCSNWKQQRWRKAPLSSTATAGSWVLTTTFVSELWTRVQSATVRSIWHLQLLFDWYLWELSNVCILYTENAKLSSFCFVWQSHIKPSASHLPCLSGPSTAEPGKNFCLWFSEVSSQFPELSSWWRCARHLPKEFVASYSVLELGFRDFFLLDRVVTPSVEEHGLPSPQIVINQRTKFTDWELC